MADRGDQDQGLGDQGLGREPGGQVLVQRTEHQIDRPGIEVGQKLADQSGTQGEGDLGILGVEPGQRQRKVEPSYDRGETERHPAWRTEDIEMTSWRAASTSARIRCVRASSSSPAWVSPTRRCPGQKGDPEFGLQPFDLCGQRRLGNVQVLGSAGEPTVPGDGLEVLQLPQVHGIYRDR